MVASATTIFNPTTFASPPEVAPDHPKQLAVVRSEVLAQLVVRPIRQRGVVAPNIRRPHLAVVRLEAEELEQRASHGGAVGEQILRFEEQERVARKGLQPAADVRRVD